MALNVGISSLIHAEIHQGGLSVLYCKIEGYVMNVCLQISRFLIVAACFDRFALCSTNAVLRKFSRVSIARRYVIPVIVLTWLIVPLHVPILITITDKTCAFVDTGSIYNSIYALLLIGILPPGLMFVFSLLIFRNLKRRQLRRRVHPSVPNQTGPVAHDQQRLKSKDQQVFAMLLVQVFAYVASSTPYTITLLYVVLNTVTTASVTASKKSTITFILFITDMLRFICPFTSFYLFLLVSRLYRHEMKSIVQRVYRRCCSRFRRDDRNALESAMSQNNQSTRQTEHR